MSNTPFSAPGSDSLQVRDQLVTALELELIGPTQRVLQVLGADAEGLEKEALDRMPNSWYPTGFLVPTETDLSLKCDDTADDDFAPPMGWICASPRGPTPTTNRDLETTAAAVSQGQPSPSCFPLRLG